MKKIIISLISILLFAACDSYVDIVPKGNTIPTTVDDLEKLMTNGSMANSGTTYGFTDVSYNIVFFDVISDDYNVPQDPNNAYYNVCKSMSSIFNTATWTDYIYGAAEDDRNWNGLYKSNYVVNYILDNIDMVEDGVTYQRNEVKGQALVHRAMNYFLLTCLYGKQYNASTSASDLAVPLVVHADINAQLPRATVKECYDQILSDLYHAIELLKVKVPKYNNIPGLATAYALRSRVYLWMQDYDKAYEDAKESLSMRSEILDYNNLQQAMPGIPAYGIIGYDTNVQTNSEVLYSRYLTESLRDTPSDKLMSIINTDKDLRYKLFISDLAMSGITEPCLWTRKHHSGIDISEVWLTKAEAALRKSSPDAAESKEALEYVRKNRYDAATYQPYQPTDDADLLQEILRERRREILFTEMAFIDHKRQNADPATAHPMSRTIYGKEYTMAVDDPHWQLAIPLNVIKLNPKLEQNER